MFIQVLQGMCRDAQGARRSMDRWSEELAPSAQGWLGTTAGVTADGEGIAVVRFASEQEARANSDRAEQGAWWDEFSRHFEGEVTVRDCRRADVWMAGGSDDAGFVQVMQSEVLDRDLAQSLIQGMADMRPEDIGRPDLIGGTVAWHSDDDGVTQVVYFTSEAAAREGEAAQPPPEVAERFADMEKALGQPRYLDLPEPWLYRPAG